MPVAESPRRGGDCSISRPPLTLTGTAARQVSLPSRQRRTIDVQVWLVDVGTVARRRPGKRVERQAISDRRITRDEKEVLGAQEPATAHPLRVVPVKRQDVPDSAAKAALEDAREPRALLLVIEFGFQRVDVRRQPPFLPEVVPDVLVGRHHVCRGPRAADRREPR